IQAGLVTYLATEEAEDHLRAVGPIYEAKRDRLLRGLKGTGLTWTPAEGGYFQVVGVSRYLKPGETDGDLARRWTRDHGIATIPMGACGPLVLCQRRPNPRRRHLSPQSHPPRTRSATGAIRG
ncbi:MAG: hypothetical protein QF427_04725, partial [Flavobacteriales bacterium]|nr:hypothetical protein [Flavobacteriales bacterium]